MQFKELDTRNRACESELAALNGRISELMRERADCVAHCTDLTGKFETSLHERDERIEVCEQRFVDARDAAADSNAEAKLE